MKGPATSMKLVLLILLASVAWGPAAANLLRATGASGAAEGEIAVRVDPAVYQELWQGSRSRVEAFPLPDGRTVDLELKPFQVIAPGAEFHRVGSEGTRIVGAPEIRFLRGHAVGEVDSTAVLTLYRGRVLGEVRIGDEAFGVGPKELSLSGIAAHDTRVWSRSNEVGSWTCGVGETDSEGLTRAVEQMQRSMEDTLPQPTGVDPQLALQWAIDSTEEWCEHHDEVAADAEAYLLSLVAQISSFYDAEIQVLVQVPFLRTFCGGAPDPYTDGLITLADRSQLLSEFSLHWRTNEAAVDRTVAHLFSWSDSNSAGGLAQTHVCVNQDCSSVLCNTNLGYGVTMLPASGANPQQFEIRVAAHELGHNHSSPHTNCLQDNSAQWISTCAIESCGTNPNCLATDCYPGPEIDTIVGTMMSTGCDSSIPTIEDDTVEGILRGNAEIATCIEAAGLPGGVRQATGPLTVSKVNSCPVQELRNDDGGLNSFFGILTGQFAWIKRYTPSCYPYQLTRVDAIIPNVSAGRPIRVLVYAEPTGSGDPGDSTLIYSEDTTVQVSNFSTFNEFTLAVPQVFNAGDLYIGFYDLQIDDPPPFIGALDTNTAQGDSFRAFNNTNPTSFSAQTGGVWMIRGQGGPVPTGSLVLDWGLPCNDVTVPGQDYGVYRGDIPNYSSYNSLTCSTNSELTYFAEQPADGSFFLIVPSTTPAEGSYGLNSAGAERPPAAAACKGQDAGACP